MWPAVLEQVEHGLAHLGEVDAHPLHEDLGRHPLALPDDRQQDVLGLTGLQEPSRASISCGVKSGPVRVTIEEYDYAAGPPDSAGWTDIVELPFLIVSGEVIFHD